MINYSKDPDRQYHLQIKSGEIGRYVITPGDPGRCEQVACYLENPVLVAQNREYITYTGMLEGEKVSVTSTGIGGPSASIAVEELFRAGADTFIRVGTCGGMELSVKGGDLVIASGAVRMEGTSREYAPLEYPAVANTDVVNALVKGAQKLGQTYHVGVVQSKDSFFGQHLPEDKPVSYELESKWRAWIRMGCLASEMESAAMFIVGSFLRVRVGAVLAVLANQERVNAGMDNPCIRDTQAVVKTAVEGVRSLILQDREK